jgi:hypothetical protein
MKGPVFYVEDDVLAREQIKEKPSPDAAIFYSLGYKDGLQEIIILLKSSDISKEELIKELTERINAMSFHNIYK